MIHQFKMYNPVFFICIATGLFNPQHNPTPLKEALYPLAWHSILPVNPTPPPPQFEVTTDILSASKFAYGHFM